MLMLIIVNNNQYCIKYADEKNVNDPLKIDQISHVSILHLHEKFCLFQSSILLYYHYCIVYYLIFIYYIHITTQPRFYRTYLVEDSKAFKQYLDWLVALH